MRLDFDDLPDTRVPQIDDRPIEEIVTDIAFHEAAHAVYGMRVGMSLDRLHVYTVDLDGLVGWTGTTHWNYCSPGKFNLAVELAAGEAAARRRLIETGVTPAEAARLAASPHDRDTAVEILGRLGYTVAVTGAGPDDPRAGTTWAQAVSAADQAVEELWSQISRTAEALLVRQPHLLDGAAVAALTGIPNGTPTH